MATIGSLERSHHDSDDVGSPTNDHSTDVELALERLADKNKPTDHKRSGCEVGVEPAFGTEDSGTASKAIQRGSSWAQ